jgi:hypothetical protein
MDKATFDRLKGNIEKDGRLESLPLGYIKKNPSGNEEFYIISGHHRIRAARSVAVKVIFVMVFDMELTDDQIVSKQLAHNAIVGESDPQVLKQLFEGIKDLDQKIASGVRDSDFDKMKFRAIAADDISVDYEFRTVKLMFLPVQLDKFDKVIAQMLEHEQVLVAKMEEFEPFAKALREVSEDIHYLGYTGYCPLNLFSNSSLLVLANQVYLIAQRHKFNPFSCLYNTGICPSPFSFKVVTILS